MLFQKSKKKMIIDKQVLHTGTENIFSSRGEKVVISPRRFVDIADDNESVSQNEYNRLHDLCKHNQVFVAPFCDSAIIYRHLLHANYNGYQILQHENLHWYTDGYLLTETSHTCNQSYGIQNNFIAEFSGDIIEPKLSTTSESKFVCMMNNNRDHRDHTLLNLHHRNMLHRGNVIYHQRMFDVPGLICRYKRTKPRNL